MGDGLILDIPFEIFLKDNSLYDASMLFIISEIIYAMSGWLVNHFPYNFEFDSFRIIELAVAPSCGEWSSQSFLIIANCKPDICH